MELEFGEASDPYDEDPDEFGFKYGDDDWGDEDEEEVLEDCP
jgi:hypothetical protein